MTYITVASIIDHTANVFFVSPDGIKGRMRHRYFTPARFACYLLAQELTHHSNPAIGRLIGGRDHSTIIHGASRARDIIGRDPEYAARVEDVRRRVLNGDAPIMEFRAPPDKILPPSKVSKPEPDSEDDSDWDELCALSAAVAQHYAMEAA